MRIELDTIKTDAIPLRAVKHSESSKIITFFTEAEGLVSLMAKGVRKTKHKTPFDTFSLMNIVYRRKRSREVQILTNGELRNGYLNIRNDLDRMAVAFGICELIFKTMQPNDAFPILFKRMMDVLECLNLKPANPRNYFWFFQMGLIESLGFGFNLDVCVNCQMDLARIEGGKLYFSYERGGVICARCGKSGEVDFTLRAESFKALHYLYSKNVCRAGRLKVSQRASWEIEKLLHSFMKYHIEGWQVLKSRQLIYRR